MDHELAAAHEDAARIRREAEADAEATRRRADAIAEARIARLRELTDRLIATAETVDRRFAEAIEVREQLDDLVAALGAAAEQVAREVLAVAAPVAPPEFEPVIEARRTSPVRVLDVALTRPRSDVS